jgi:uncharacterized protein (DUF1501 family)
MMDRRRFLRLALGVAGGSVTWRLWALPAGGNGPRVVVVFLRGAYDALSVLVPYAESFYYEARPNIALGRPDRSSGDAALPLDGRWALHPTLGDSLMPFWQAGQLAFVPFSGTGFVSRSHFQAQDWLEFGRAPSERPSAGSGFLNRLLSRLGTPAVAGSRAVSFTQTMPPIMRGGIQVANSPLTAPKGGRGVEANYESLLLNMYSGHPLEEMVRDGLGLRREISRELAEEMQAASREALPAGSFALEAGRVGKLLSEHPNYSLAFVDVGGWDTHAGQGGAQGALANRLHGLGDGLKALSEGLGPEWGKTVVVVISEFGRTFRENGSRGTDHGHGSAIWVLGGAVRGGAIRGEQAGLKSGDLHEDRDVPVLNEYRGVLGGIFQKLYGLGREDLADIFPQASVVDLGLV